MAGTDAGNLAPTDSVVLFHTLELVTDPDVDPLIDLLRQDEELSDPASLMHAAIQALEGRDTPLSRRLRLLGPELPDWGHDKAKIEAGQKVFNDHALAFAAALFFASLPIAYATPEGTPRP